MKHFARAMLFAVPVLIAAAVVDVVGNSPALAQASAALDSARQQKLLSLLGSKGFESTFDKNLAGLLGVSYKGQNVPTRKVQFYNDTVMYAFSRITAGGTGYFFFFDPERNNENSAAICFRTDLNFRLVGVGAEWFNGRPQRMTPRRTAELFAEQMEDWAKVIDGNDPGAVHGGSRERPETSQPAQPGSNPRR